MTPKEKAKQLIEEFEYKVRDLDGECSLTLDEAKMCALICVNEQLEQLKQFTDNYSVRFQRLHLEEVKKRLHQI